MAIISTLKILSRSAVVRNCQKVPVRFGGHDHKIRIEPSRHIWNTFKDYLHFYFMLGAIPLTLLTAYVNIFIGDAELTEIPEGYTPHHWEYYKHPITRFLAKNVFPDKARLYESSVSKMAEESEKYLLHKVKKQLQAKMAEKADNKAWYYVPVDPSSNRWVLEYNRQSEMNNLGIDDEGEFKGDQ